MAKLGGKRKRKKKTSGLYLSTMVIHRIKDAMSLVSSIQTYREKLGAGLAEHTASPITSARPVP